MPSSLSEWPLYLLEQYDVARGVLAPLRLSWWDLFHLTCRKMAHDLLLSLRDLREVGFQQYVSPYGTTLIVLLAVTIFYASDKAISRFTSLSRKGLPILKKPRGVHPWDFKAILEEGTRVYPESPYILSSAEYEFVVFPSSMTDELKRHPASHASALEFLTDVYFQGWRFLGDSTSVLHKTISVEFTRLLRNSTLRQPGDAESAFQAALGDCGEWISIPLYQKMQEIVARLNAIVLVGPRLGTDTRWLKSVQWFPMALMVAVYFNHSIPRSLRRILSPLSLFPAFVIWQYMKSLARPISSKASVLSRRYNGTSGIPEAPSTRNESPFLECLLARYQNTSSSSVGDLTRDLLVASFESTPSTSIALYTMVTELVHRPLLIEILREEIQHHMLDGQAFCEMDLSRLTKLDSFMREAARLNPFGYLTMIRKTMVSIRFSKGPELPAGTLVGIDAHSIAESDPTLEDPGTFNAMRFHELRANRDHEARYRFSSITPGFPNWGDGTQACPGRVFADSTLKIALITLLMEFDFRYPTNQVRPKRRCMPNGAIAPDLDARLLIRRRATHSRTGGKAAADATAVRRQLA
ncbi:cytochrome P450 [Xylariaceae sp. FL1272]|nr:cytochrome P450 [Xylariaceae sp. FL1272]